MTSIALRPPLTAIRIHITAARLVAAALPVVAGVAYWLTGPDSTGGDIYYALADAFLHGRLTVEPRSWIELVPTDAGWVVPFPPVPALLYLPVATVVGSVPWHAEPSVNPMPALVGGASVALAYWLLAGWRVSMNGRLWLTAGYATAIWWVAGTGGHHFLAHVTGLAFALAAFNLAVRDRWPALAGLLLGLAAGSRLPMGLALPALLALYGWRPRLAHGQLLAGLALPALAFAWYNLARFGSPVEMGYGLIVYGAPPVSVLSEAIYADGILSWSYIPRSLVGMLLVGFQPDWYAPPFVRPDLRGLSLWIAAPWMFWALAARGRLAAVLGVSFLLVMLPNWMHGNPGYTQVGYRFVLDAVPLVLLALGLAYPQRLPTVVKIGVVVSIAVMLYSSLAVFVWGVAY